MIYAVSYFVREREDSKKGNEHYLGHTDYDYASNSYVLSYHTHCLCYFLTAVADGLLASKLSSARRRENHSRLVLYPHAPAPISPCC